MDISDSLGDAATRLIPDLYPCGGVTAQFTDISVSA